MKNNIIYFKRSFLRTKSLNGASVLLYKDDYTIGGSFRLAWDDKVVTIHSLDLEPDSTEQFAKKLDLLKTSLSCFIDALKNKTDCIYRNWLNPENSFATGSVAYACCKSNSITACYFELSSCTDKIRIYETEFKNTKSYIYCLQKLNTLIEDLLSELQEIK